MSTTAGSANAGVVTDERQRELQAFDDTKAGVMGLVDAGVTAIPAIFHHPPDALALDSPSCDDDAAAIPVVDLSGATREEVVAQVRAAAEAVGFFQVVNHGVPGELMDAMLAGIKRFNEGPAEAKRRVYTRDTAHKVRFNSNFDIFKSAAANWRDTLFCELAPVPPSPEELPDAVSDAVTKVAMQVLELLSESLGLPSAHLREMGCAEGLNVVSHYSPPCPEPHLTLGTSIHTDPAFLTVLLQDGVGGLQVLVDRRGGRSSVTIGSGAWSTVCWRTGGDTPRLSVACFFNTDDKKRLYGPITEGSCDPPVYRSVTAVEYFTLFYGNGLQGRLLDYFRLQH
ncbi:hypothetical protein HU200_005673 [Digitaria exilis]|uniref:Fe2OG dioxygenase domain-containing protein n=1 Tax=Digitaria exilis TaxID=1010633 RepID=A0A835FUC2_9POAL|nr:hypothetical protein HU200_005673 [Digitaria exilis]